MATSKRGSVRRLVLIRHGESEANADRSVLHRRDYFAQHVKLTRLGHEQARRCGKAIERLLIERPYAVFMSPYLRARQTWEEIFSVVEVLPESVIVDGRLREQEYKDVTTSEELDEKKQRARMRGKLYYRYKGGESGYDVLNRVGSFYNQLRFDMQQGSIHGTVLLVCHEVVMRCLLLVALGLDPDEYEKLEFQNCEVVELRANAQLRFTRVS